MTTQYLGSSDQGPQFLSVEDGKKTIMHSIAAWLIDEDNKAAPILYPAPKPDAVIFYQVPGNQNVTELTTGKSYQSIGKAIEALQ
ncbi:MAG: hypothetical protein WCP01_13585 [Methylococcaceae bacterium]